ncbi:hypothetical protein LRS71_23520 [Rhodococcus pyridinivorans]|uniref:hypothetical protein n=1 Tax=Rhodococcus pyridinivorans TaxID=103816 RepID=UPI001E438B0C|nr:hypothetical protein [Rhodococcus pyridinivorans]MCD5422486.1 hypothetical protein [Rhodococcus pyridinivorans]
MSEHAGAELSSAEQFRVELTRLFEAAGSPKLAVLTRWGAARNIRLADSTLSGWLTGRSIPSNGPAFGLLVKYLGDKSGETPDLLVCLRECAWNDSHARRGGRPRRPVERNPRRAPASERDVGVAVPTVDPTMDHTCRGDIDPAHVELFTRTKFSWALWGRDGDEPYEAGRYRLETARHLAQSDPVLGEHLDAAMRVVPDCSSRPAGSSLHGDFVVGPLSAKITAHVVLRTVGAATAGICLRDSPGEATLRPDVLDRVRSWVTYSVHIDDSSRQEVNPGRPVLVPVVVFVRLTTSSTRPEYDPVLLVRQVQAFARYLAQPLEGIRIDAVLDTGDTIGQAVRITVPDARTRFATDPFDVNALEDHIRKIDAAVEAHNDRNNCVLWHLQNVRRLEPMLSKSNEITDEDRGLLAETADELAGDDLESVVLAWTNGQGEPVDAAVVRVACRELHTASMNPDASHDDLVERIRVLLAVFGW